MARPWGIEYEGALYNLYSSDNNHQHIFMTDDDRHIFLDKIAQNVRAV